ncbi:MAG: InlB B-repeat-containing protein, partial [Bacteroidales bacterium]|nr:InlB B-repeat-containing protein [Bacteroidales bacterium]
MKNQNKRVTLLPAILTLVLLIGVGSAWGQTWEHKDFSSTQDWSIPVGTTKIVIEAIGGGGGGGTAYNPDYFWGELRFSTGGGGGGGAYARLKEYSITSGTLNVTVGGQGQTSSVKLNSTTTLISAGGGSAGGNGKNSAGGAGGGGTYSSDLGTTYYDGANGSSGSSGTHINGNNQADNNKGGAGGACGKLSSSIKNPNGGELICNEYSGAGGAETNGSSGWSAGNGGSAYGGGGGGGRTQRAGGGTGRGDKGGGTGHQGFVRVWYYRAVNITFDANMPQRDVNMNAAIPANTTITYGSAFGNKLDWQNDSYRTSYRRGYTFGGWYLNAECTGTEIKSTSTSNFTTDQTLYAKWTPVSMTVQYHRNGGQWASGHTPTPSNATYTVSYGSTYREQMTGFDWTLPVRSGHVFMGWNTKQDGTGLFFGPDAHVGLTTDHHLYAYWVEEENLPPAITTCFEGTSQLCAPSNYSGYTWSPAVGLSSTTGKCVTLTSANMSSNNVTYTCTYAKGNVANFDFSQGNAGFSSDYEIVTDEADRNNELQPERAVSVTDCWHHVHGSLDPDCSLTSYEDGAAGKFLAVNGGAVANAVVYEQTIAVTRNTNYRLSAMYANAAGTGDITSATARLMFFVNGVRASAATDTAFANEHAWKEMYTTWNSGSNDFATIQIRDFATATQGNDFALDHILFEATTGTQSGTYTVTVTRRQQLNPGAITPETETITRGQTFSKTVTPSTPTGGDGQYKYQWYVNGTAISGATGASLAIPTDPYTNVPGTYEFKRFVYDESDCGQVYSTGSYTLTVLNNLALTLDCPTASTGNCYSFPDATFEGYATHVTVSFSDIPAAGSSLNLPSYVTTANGFERVDITPYSKKIVLPEGYTSAQIQQLIRDITFCIPAGTHSSVRIGADMAASESDIYYFSGNDHYYKYVPYTTADVGHETWVSSYEKAKNSTLYGRKGYLATPTTYEEDIFLTKVSQSVAWLGATRLLNTGVDPNNDQYYLGFNISETAQTVAGGNQTWYWACGPEKGQMLVDRATACQSFHDHSSTSLDNLYDYFYNNLHIYSNWNGHGQGEPNGGNNFTGDPSIECQYDNTHVESCLTILQVGGDASNDYYTGRGHLRKADTTHFSWNDIGYDKIGSSSSYTARGYIIEYGDQTFSNSTDDVFDANEMVQAVGNIGTFELTAETPICSGSTSTLTATPTFPPYKWYEGSTATGTPVQSGSSNTYTTAALTADATYTVVANDDQCAQTKTVTVVVTPNLTAPTTITYDTNICNGDDVTFTATGGTGSDDEIFWSETGCPEAAFFEDFKTIKSGYTPKNTTLYVNDQGNLVVTATGSDPWINMYSLGSFDPSAYRYYQMRYKVLSGTAGSAEFFFANGVNNSATTYYSIPVSLNSDGEWHIATFNTANAAQSGSWLSGGNITGWRFDYSSSSDVTMEIDYIALTNAPHVGSTYTMTGPAAGTHTVYADRLSGCHTGTCYSKNYTIPEPLTITQVDTTVNAKCKDDENGEFKFTVSGGTPNYTVSVKKGTVDVPAANISNSGNTYTVSNLSVGTYTVSVTDAHYCTATGTTSYEVTEPAETLTATAALVNPDSCQGNKGKATVTPAGGNGSYEFRWSDEQTSQTATGLSSVTNSGAYTVTVTDAKGCTANASVTVTLYNPLAMNDITGPTICTGNEFVITPANVTNGVIPDGTTYSWPAPENVPDCVTGSGLNAMV